jgi:hypothetical protein
LFCFVCGIFIYLYNNKKSYLLARVFDRLGMAAERNAAARAFAEAQRGIAAGLWLKGRKFERVGRTFEHLWWKFERLGLKFERLGPRIEREMNKSKNLEKCSEKRNGN